VNAQATVGLAVFILVCVVLFLAYTGHKQAQQNALRRTLIEKFGSAQDLGTFLQSEGGRRFMEGLTQEGPLASVLGSVQKGIVLLLLGLGCIGASAPTNFIAAMGVGMVLFAVGIGFLISAAVTYLLSRRLGLIGKRSDS
jgi:hypothetical protein